MWSPEGKGLISWLLFVMFIVILLLSPLASWDRCGTWLYLFLILAVFLTYIQSNTLWFYVNQVTRILWHLLFNNGRYQNLIMCGSRGWGDREVWTPLENIKDIGFLSGTGWSLKITKLPIQNSMLAHHLNGVLLAGHWCIHWFEIYLSILYRAIDFYKKKYN